MPGPASITGFSSIAAALVCSYTNFSDLFPVYVASIQYFFALVSLQQLNVPCVICVSIRNAFPVPEKKGIREKKGTKGGEYLPTDERLPGFSLDLPHTCFDFVSVLPPET